MGTLEAFFKSLNRYPEQDQRRKKLSHKNASAGQNVTPKPSISLHNPSCGSAATATVNEQIENHLASNITAGLLNYLRNAFITI